MTVNKIYFSYDANDYVKEIAKKHTESDITIYGRKDGDDIIKYRIFLHCFGYCFFRRFFPTIYVPEIFHYISLRIRAPIS